MHTRTSHPETKAAMTSIPCWQVDAFTAEPFRGNPAAVVWLERAADPGWMQKVAAEMNLAETAFVRPLAEGLELRWFTPTIEVDLCGHATLASAHALWQAGLASSSEPLRFSTRSGWLTCSTVSNRDGSTWIQLDFPATPAAPLAAPNSLAAALGVQPVEVLQSKFDYLAVLDSAETVRALRPNLRELAQLPVRGVIVTARGDDGMYDFVSRFFGPASGVDEDPVTGSAHCALGPYWGAKLNQRQLLAYQASARGGTVQVELAGERVLLRGQAVTVWRGELV
jgi:PhzF family phenazine biosynthesis protein